MQRTVFIENGEIDPEELISVFKSVGWNKSIDNIAEAFRNSWYILAYENHKLVGFARAISDEFYYTSIFDVVVEPEFQNKGIAKHMVERIKKRFEGTYFFLTYTKGKRDFYSKCGFEENLFAMWISK